MRVLALCILFMGSLVARAETFRCGERLTRVGDSMAAVRAACGEPRAVYDAGTLERGTTRIRQPDAPQNPTTRDTVAVVRRQSLPVVRWEYSPGAGQFLRILSFEGDRLTAIELGPRQ